MRLRSVKVATNNEAIPKRGYVRRMANSPIKNGEQPPRSTRETMAVTSVSEAIPSTESTMTISWSTHTGLILSTMRMYGQPVTPPSVGTGAFRPYVYGFTMPLNGHEQPYGILTSMMGNLHNATSTFADPLMNMFSPLQGYGSTVNNMGQINNPRGWYFLPSKCPILLQTLQQF